HEGDQCGVVDIGDDAQPRLGRDDSHPGVCGGGGLGVDLHVVPARLEIVAGDGQVDVPATVGDGLVLGVAHAHRHRQVGHWSAEVGAPAAPGEQVADHRDGPAVPGRLLSAQDRSAQHTHEVRIAVADIAHGARPPAAFAQKGDEAAVE